MTVWNSWICKVCKRELHMSHKFRWVMINGRRTRACVECYAAAQARRAELRNGTNKGTSPLEMQELRNGDFRTGVTDRAKSI